LLFVIWTKFRNFFQGFHALLSPSLFALSGKSGIDKLPCDFSPHVVDQELFRGQSIGGCVYWHVV
jgi:hypothetical protein